MGDSPATSLDVAFRLIDSITTIKDVLGAAIVDETGAVVAQDFVSQDAQDRGWPIATEMVPAISEAASQMEYTQAGDLVLQTSDLLVRSIYRSALFIVIFAEKSINLGMLNVDLRAREDMMRTLAGDSIISERDHERDRIIEVLRAEGSVDSLIAEKTDLGSLRAFHGLMFQAALDIDVDRDLLTARLNDINYRIYRDSLLDIGFDFFNRKTLDNYDPALARTVVSAQIVGIAEIMVTKLP